MAARTQPTDSEYHICLSGVDGKQARSPRNFAKADLTMSGLAETLASIELISRANGTNGDALDPFDGLRDALFSFLSVYEHTNDVILDPNVVLPSLPTELIAEIGSFLPSSDLQNLRLCSKRFRFAVKIIFGKDLVDNTTIFPTFSSVAAFLALLLVEPTFPAKVCSLTLVGEAPRMHEYGYEWAWEQMQDEEGVVISTANDWYVKDYINHKHAEWCHANEAFCYGGGYRTMLTLLLSRLPNLLTITTRPLNPGEHIPDMPFLPALHTLSFYHPHLPTSSIFYGDWQYDTLHKRVTVFKDEFGDDVTEAGAGPQASFMDDVRAALEAVRATGVVVEMFG
ncbi:hypothetical protein DDE82_006072 [Stemphylium lycopersici]|nr:hypothetical protein TW65_06422 [Stemphylium lycopersici]RAR02036.1 hypothetical protein DDE82_006072 [Stemphylium lycopersici]